MYILKNAFRNVVRSKGRNILMGIIIFIIAVSLCIGLSIRQAAANAKETALENLEITAQISVDRTKMMQNSMQDGGDGERPSFNKDDFGGFSDSLTIDELEVYAKASTVKNFYYTITSSFDSAGDIDPVTDTASSDEASQTSQTEEQNGMPGGEAPGGSEGNRGGMQMSSNGDFTVIGYSDDSAMTDFIDGNSTITDGAVFEAGTSDYDCIISEELATYNSLEVGDTIELANPNNEDETYTLTISGIYSNDSSNSENAMGRMFSSADPSNQIYMSYTALKDITDKSQETNSDDSDSALFSQTNGTYVFENADDYETFCDEVYELGLSEDYTVSSQDVNNYEQSLIPLETLSTIAGYFLLVIVIIGTLILVALNIFSIRERKYEIGVLTAIGMKKAKVAAQFICEMLIVTLAAVIIGGAVGAATSVPVANTLLENQITSQHQVSDNRQNAFGREPGGNMNGDSPQKNDEQGSNMDSNASDSATSQPMGAAGRYISQINAAVDVAVMLELLGICILLALLSSAVSVTAIMRYDPMKILANRD